jgi:hypothetical protein
VHGKQCQNENTDQDAGSRYVRHAEIGELSKVAPEDRTAQHHRSADNLATGKDALELTIEACCGQRIDEPGLRGTREEGESEPEKRRHDRPPDEWRTELPQQDVETGGRRQCQRAA